MSLLPWAPKPICTVPRASDLRPKMDAASQPGFWTPQTPKHDACSSSRIYRTPYISDLITHKWELDPKGRNSVILLWIDTVKKALYQSTGAHTNGSRSPSTQTSRLPNAQRPHPPPAIIQPPYIPRNRRSLGQNLRIPNPLVF